MNLIWVCSYIKLTEMIGWNLTKGAYIKIRRNAQTSLVLQRTRSPKALRTWNPTQQEAPATESVCLAGWTVHHCTTPILHLSVKTQSSPVHRAHAELARHPGETFLCQEVQGEGEGIPQKLSHLPFCESSCFRLDLVLQSVPSTVNEGRSIQPLQWGALGIYPMGHNAVT